MKITFLVLSALALAVSASAQGTREDSTAIVSTLDQLHDAASKADGKRYFPLFTDDAVYIGTDAGEHWTISQFRAFAEPYFDKGTGWTYKPRSRNVTIAAIPCRCVAWFDELLDSESYGTSRGTGVLVKNDGRWRIAQYALTFPIPNDLAKGMTAEIKAFETRKSSTADDEKAIHDLNARWFRTYNAHDPAALAAFYADDALLMMPGTPTVRGRDAIQAAYKKDMDGMAKAGYSNNQGNSSELGVAGDIAWESNTFTVTDQKGKQVGTGKYVTVFARRDGQWRIVRDIWNSDSPPPES